MTRTVFPCYAPADRALAAGLAEYLEAGADVRVFLDEGALQPGEDLASRAREARTADIVLVLFSRNSLPSPWPRSRWQAALQDEPAAEMVPIAFLRCDDCAPPRVLAPRFDWPSDRRWLKRWIRSHGDVPTLPSVSPALAAQVEDLALTLADRPGLATVDHTELVLAFASAFAADFDSIHHLHCASRSPCALAGQLAQQLGLRLEGDLPSNLTALRDYCSAHRLLLILYQPAAITPHPFVFGGRCSILSCTAPPLENPPLPESLLAIQQLFSQPLAPLAWPEHCRLARIGRRLTTDAGRIAECYELMEQWHAAAAACADHRVQQEAAREMVWILESWGHFDAARQLHSRYTIETDRQLSLPFADASPLAGLLLLQPPD